MNLDAYTRAQIAPHGPELGAYVERIFAGRGGAYDWPAWCYLPLSAVGTYLRGMGDLQAQMQAAQITCALTWRVTRSIYRFDADLFRELQRTRTKGKLPCQLLLTLPEWCVFIETPGLAATPEASVRVESPGFFAWLEHDTESGPPELRLWVLYRLPAGSLQGMPHVLHLVDGGDLDAAVASAIAETQRQSRLHGQDLPSVVRAALLEQTAEAYAARLPLILYLCSARPDVAGGWPPNRPSAKGARRRRKTLMQAKPAKTWDVGLRIGEQLRTAWAAAEQRGEVTGEGGERHAPRPHVRRAHWHTYWVGPGRQTPELRWLSPILVGAHSEDEAPVTVRPVADEA